MKAITLRLTEKDRKDLERVKSLGFGSVTEVIKCAALSMVDAHSGKSAKKRQAVPA